MKMFKIKLSKEELKSLYHYHMDIVEDKSFNCKYHHNKRVAADRLKRATRLGKILKKYFKCEIPKKATED